MLYKRCLDLVTDELVHCLVVKPLVLVMGAKVLHDIRQYRSFIRYSLRQLLRNHVAYFWLKLFKIIAELLRPRVVEIVVERRVLDTGLSAQVYPERVLLDRRSLKITVNGHLYRLHRAVEPRFHVLKEDLLKFCLPFVHLQGVGYYTQ